MRSSPAIVCAAALVLCACGTTIERFASDGRTVRERIKVPWPAQYEEFSDGTYSRVLPADGPTTVAMQLGVQLIKVSPEIFASLSQRAIEAAQKTQEKEAVK